MRMYDDYKKVGKSEDDKVKEYARRYWKLHYVFKDICEMEDLSVKNPEIYAKCLEAGFKKDYKETK